MFLVWKFIQDGRKKKLNMHMCRHTYDDCEEFRYFHGNLPRAPPSPLSPPFSPTLPFFPPTFVEDYRKHHQVNYIILSSIILALILMSSLLITKLYYRRRRRLSEDVRNNHEDDKNEIPMVTIVIHPDQSSSLADENT